MKQLIRIQDVYDTEDRADPAKPRKAKAIWFMWRDRFEIIFLPVEKADEKAFKAYMAKRFGLRAKDIELRYRHAWLKEHMMKR